MTKCTVEFMRLAERNNLMEIEGSRCQDIWDGIKPVIQDAIGVLMLMSLLEARKWR